MPLDLDDALRSLRKVLMLIGDGRIEEAEISYYELLRWHPGLPKFLGRCVFAERMEQAGHPERARKALARWQGEHPR